MPQPNFIFILIDDLGWRDLSCYHSPFYETPNLDRLAKGGMQFSDAYAACPVCSPTRASILTGKYPARLGLTQYIGGDDKGKLISAPYIRYLPLEEKTIATALREASYHTYHVGKWHLGSEAYWPEHHGFEVNIGGCDWGGPNHGYFSPWDNPRLSNGPKGEYLTDRLTDEAIKLIQQSGSDPFFMYLAYYAVHIPIQTPEKYTQKYNEKAHELKLDKEKTFEVGEYFPLETKRNKHVTRRLIQSDPAYAGMIENLDENIGRLMQSLDDLGLAQDTVIFFNSDNGGLATAEGSPTCNAPLCEGKGWMYEGGTRDPLIVRWPGVIEANSICSIPVTSTDYYPTILQMAGLDLIPDQHRDGVSILPLLNGMNEIDREALFWHYPHYGNQGGTPGTSMRRGDYKLLEFYEDNHFELYNLRDDIGEERDLAEEMPDLVGDMSKRLADWKIDVGAKLPTPNSHYKPPFDIKSLFHHH